MSSSLFSYRCKNCCVASSQTLADRMLDACCYSAVYSQSGIKSMFKTPHDALPERAKELLETLLEGRRDATRQKANDLESLERKIQDFKDRHRTFFTDLSAKKHIEDAVRALKANLSQANAMKTFDEGLIFLAESEKREETSKKILRLYDEKGVASCQFACEAEDAEALHRLIREHEENGCEFVEDRCQRCGERFSKKFRKRHDEKVCPLFEVECPLKCGAVLKRNQVELHATNHCENRALECPYEKFDCCAAKTEPITKKTFNAHLKEHCANHLFMVTQKLLPKMQVLERDHVRLEKQLHDHAQTNSRNHEKLKHFSEEELKWTKNNFGHVETRLKACEQALEKERRDKLALMKRIENIEKAMLARK